eukprot:Clim_evm47s231 gene=Clim_evmTU47s231
MELEGILKNALSPDPNARAQSLQQLEQAEQQFFQQFVVALADLLADESKGDDTRRLAGLRLKNTLTSRNEGIRSSMFNRWRSIEIGTRQTLHGTFLRTLESPKPSIAPIIAQVISKVASAELMHGEWPELIHSLLRNVTKSDPSIPLKLSTLETIGYVCEEVHPSVLAAQSNEILTAVVHCMKKTEPSEEVRVTATKTLSNAVPFIRANFESEPERNYIMQILCENMVSNIVPLVKSGLVCLVQIAEHYYEYLQSYMMALFHITTQCLKSNNDDISMLALDFWDSISTQEKELECDRIEAEERGEAPDTVSMHYCRGALPQLVPLILQKMTLQTDDVEDSGLSISQAAGVSLNFLAETCEDSVVEHVMPFVRDHIQHGDWHYREAAVMAFASILEGPSMKVLDQQVRGALPVIAQLLGDENVQVRDSAAWAVGKICEQYPDVCLPDEVFPHLIQALAPNLESAPRVAVNVCWAISTLSEAAYEQAQETQDKEIPNTYKLSQYYKDLVHKLVAVTDRQDADESHLRTSAYDALMVLIQTSPEDCYMVVKDIAMEIIHRLLAVAEMDAKATNQDDKRRITQIVGLLCGNVQAMSKRLVKADLKMVADAIMKAAFQLLETAQTRYGTVHEDALLAVNIVMERLEEDFAPYLERFLPYLLTGLRNIEEAEVCHICVGIVGDLALSLGGKVLAYNTFDVFMEVLVENLRNDRLDDSVKPSILSAFGDVALAFGPQFQRYLGIVMDVLASASQYSVETDDYDKLEWIYQLRDNCLTAYQMIVQGLGTEGISGFNPAYTVHMLDFIVRVARDRESPETVLSKAAGLLGDIAHVFKQQATPLLKEREADLLHLLQRCERTKTAKTRDTARWAHQMVTKAAAA